MSVYLVVDPIEIIAADLAMTVQECDPAAAIIVAPRAEDAMTALALQGRVAVAFLHADPAGFDATELGRALAVQGTACVFMGDAAERFGPGVTVLERPFSPATIAEMLAHLRYGATG